MAHSPIEHVVDEKGQWTFFNELCGGPMELPLLKIKVGDFSFVMTKFMILELIAAGLILAIFIPLARRAAAGGTPKGPWWNAFESLLTFIRDQVARPTLAAPADAHHGAGHGTHAHAEAAHGEHAHPEHGHAHAPAAPDYDAYVPFLWTLFLFILFCNLLGLFPFMGSPTASIWVTGALALVAFVMMHAAAIVEMGFLPYVKTLWLKAEGPLPMKLFMWIFINPMIFVIELFGTVIKAGVLAVRLFANMFAGHMVLAMILFFIIQAATNIYIWGGVTIASVLGVVALSLLELFVAFLQAYIFTFLTALFMGMALHPQH